MEFFLKNGGCKGHIFGTLYFGNFENLGLERVPGDRFRECTVNGVGSEMVGSQR